MQPMAEVWQREEGWGDRVSGGGGGKGGGGGGRGRGGRRGRAGVRAGGEAHLHNRACVGDNLHDGRGSNTHHTLANEFCDHSSSLCVLTGELDCAFEEDSRCIAV